jgi:hypothetical protein
MSRGYHSSGVAMRRPSINVTTSSVAVNSTVRARRSPTSISKVLMPRTQQFIAIRSQSANNIAYFMRWKPGVSGYRYIMKPEFGLHVAAADMNMRGLGALIRVEECPIRSPTQNCRHPSCPSYDRQKITTADCRASSLASRHACRAASPAPAPLSSASSAA